MLKPVIQLINDNPFTNWTHTYKEFVVDFFLPNMKIAVCKAEFVAKLLWWARGKSLNYIAFICFHVFVSAILFLKNYAVFLVLIVFYCDERDRREHLNNFVPNFNGLIFCLLVSLQLSFQNENITIKRRIQSTNIALLYRYLVAFWFAESAQLS